MFQLMRRNICSKHLWCYVLSSATGKLLSAETIKLYIELLWYLGTLPLEFFLYTLSIPSQYVLITQVTCWVFCLSVFGKSHNDW